MISSSSPHSLLTQPQAEPQRKLGYGPRYVRNPKSHRESAGKFLHLALVLAGHQRQGYDPADVHIRAVDVDIQFQLLPDRFDVLQAFLVIGSGPANPNLDPVLD